MDLLGAFDFVLFLIFRLLLLLRDRCVVIVRFGNVLRDDSLFRDDTRSQRPSKFESLISFLLSLLSGNMDKFMDSPSFLETILTTKI